MSRVRRVTPDDVAAIRAGAPKRAPNVRVLANFSNHADCALAALGFAAGVDFDRILEGTPLKAAYGMSPFAFARGNSFERSIAEGGYGPVLTLLREKMGFDVADARVIDLRSPYAKNRDGMRLRAHDTRSLLREITRRDPGAPNLIDGAVLETEVGGIRAHFEADSLAARFGGPLHTGEIKSFPVVDGHTDAEKAGSALDQAAVYTLLTMETIEALGGDSQIVSPKALLITPKNVGLTPTLTPVDVTRRIERARRLLSSVPSMPDLAGVLRPGTSFGPIADGSLEPDRRLESLHRLADDVGTTYVETCTSHCGLHRFCRSRARDGGCPSLLGQKGVRLLPNVVSLDRAAELAEGAPPSEAERPVAELLARASRLYEAARTPVR